MLSDIDILLTRDKQDFLENEKLQQTRWMAKVKSPQELLSLLEEDEGFKLQGVPEVARIDSRYQLMIESPKR